ncbi:hypothetical protein MUN88_01480 [Gracilibacillus caseinilyticus]|nr:MULTISPECIES: hypothetical protein [Bacillaceae]UOQ48841.1 hypothetical protein MUN88_01480 [Gracilibacillus caseinilyticus]
MSNQDKVDIFDILTMFNEEVGFKGLDNTDKTTDERDDVISRQTFNNWLREYNETHSGQIKSKKVNQYQNEWFKSDIQKLIKNNRVQKNLHKAYIRNTVPLFEHWESISSLSSKRVSKKYKNVQEDLRNKSNSESLGELIEMTMNQLIDEVIEKYFTVTFGDTQINQTFYLDRAKILEDFIDTEKIENEAFKIVDNYYGTPEYDEQGVLVNIHSFMERPKTDYYLT